MKKYFTIIIALILLVSCRAQKENIGLNLTKGETYHQKLISDATIIQNVNGQKNKSNIKIDFKISYKVNDIQNSTYDMEVRYESLKMAMGLPSSEFEFNSEKNDNTDIMSVLLASIKNKPFNIKMTKNGKMIESRNTENLFAGIFDKFPQIPEMQKQQIIAQLKQSFGEKALKGSMEMTSAIFPENPVSKGDKWITNTQMGGQIPAIIETSFQLKEINDSYELISGDGKIKTDDHDGVTPPGSMPIKYDINGTMISEIKIDKKTGWVIESKIKQQIKGTGKIMDNPQMPGGISIPMEMTSETTITN